MIEIGTKVHVVYRALYENSVRRHFVGLVATDGSDFRLDINEFSMKH